MPDVVGFVGLGNMGSKLAPNLARAGHRVVAHDAIGPERTPEGATHAADVAEVAGHATWSCSAFPTEPRSKQVARDIVAVADRRATHVVDTSTIGVEAA